MTNERLGGIAMIASSIAGIITMSFHPAGRELLAPGQFASVALVNGTVHALAIASLPVAFLGGLALARHTLLASRLALAALVVYGFALVAGMAAAAVSGWVATSVMREVLDAAPASVEGWRLLAGFSHLLNQAFARIYAVGAASAILLWSAAILKHRTLAQWVGIYGVASAALIILAVGSGHLPLHVHGMGLVVLSQAAWFVAAGILMVRHGEPGPGSERRPAAN